MIWVRAVDASSQKSEVNDRSHLFCSWPNRDPPMGLDPVRSPAPLLLKCGISPSEKNMWNKCKLHFTMRKQKTEPRAPALLEQIPWSTFCFIGPTNGYSLVSHWRQRRGNYSYGYCFTERVEHTYRNMGREKKKYKHENEKVSLVLLDLVWHCRDKLTNKLL